MHLYMYFVIVYIYVHGKYYGIIKGNAELENLGIYILGIHIRIFSYM